MPFTESLIFTLNKLNPVIVPERAITLARRVQANQTLLKGQPIGIATTAVNAVQTITMTGTPTGGTFRLSFLGIKTAALAHNSTAAQVQTALQALVSIGSGNVTCSGGPFPGTAIVCTFAGTLAGQPVAPIVFEAADNLLTGGSGPTATVAQTTTGVVVGGIKNWVGDLMAQPSAPTVSAVAGGTVFGDGTNSIPYTVTVTFFNESGESLPSAPATVLVTAANRTIRVNAITPVNAALTQGVRYYVNGNLAGQTLVAGGTAAQTDLTAFQAANIPQPDMNTMYAVRDGSHILRGFVEVDTYSDAEGRVTLGRVTTGNEQYQELFETAIYVEGFFRIGDLNGITVANGPQLARFGRFISGDATDAEGIYRLGLL